MLSLHMPLLRGLVAYVLAAGAIGTATFVGGHGPTPGNRLFPLLVLMVAVLLTAIAGGARASSAATLLGLLVLAGRHAPAATVDAVDLGLFGLCGGLISLNAAQVEACRRRDREEATRHEAMDRALQRSEAHLRFLYTSNVIGVVHSTGSGLVIDANDFVLHLLGYSREELIGGRMRWLDLTPAEYRPLDFRRIAEARERGACTPYEKAYVRRDGRRVPVMIGYARVEGAADEFICFIVDLTPQKRAEAAMADQITWEMLLDSERAARAEMERANRAKDDFLAMLSHELRTPLNAILGWATLARRPGQTAEQVDRALSIVDRNGRALAQLISDLLDVSRIASGKLRVDLSPIDFAAAIEGAIDSVRATAEAKGISLAAALDRAGAIVLGDGARLQQVVWNLITNSIKFTPRGGRVEVSLTTTDARASLTVRDTGQGIDAAFLPSMFERFRQAEASASRSHGGLGLGLAIVKHLVDLHGGTVRAESPGPGLGATFTIELPKLLLPERVELEPASLPSVSRLAGARVLVVDDEPEALELVKRLLEEHGAAVLTAASGAEALGVMADAPVDAVVSDIGMPGMDGYELVRRLHAIPAAKGVPAVALTAYARSEDRARALGAGFQAHLAKPVDPAEMLATVAGVLREDAPRLDPPAPLGAPPGGC